MRPVQDQSRSFCGVIAMFENRVRRQPHATAVVDDAREWTYAELDRASGAVRRSLTDSGCGHGDLVAVVMTNSAHLIAVLLGILKSGAGYVPVSSDDPDERVDRIVEDSRAALTVVDDSSRFTDRAGSDAVVRVGELMRGDPGEPSGRSTAPQRRTDPPSPNDTAYVIYTSGSTGTPKGVVIDHAALAAYLRFAASAYPALAGRTLLHSSISFDMSVTSLFGPLVRGGTIEIGNLTHIANGGPPSHLLKPTFLKVTPSHLPMLEVLPSTVSPSELLVVGGEALHWETLRRWWDRHSGTAVINEYGPTEATVGCCVHRVDPHGPRSGAVPIGEPTEGTRLHVLNGQGREAGAGEPGVLHIAGEQLAQGYLHCPEMTSERFVPYPFGAPGSKMYRTGDLVRRQPSGALEYIGREDDQVKIDGHRVEPGEVESAMLRSTAVAQAAVVATETTAGSNRLAAFVRPVDGTDFDAGVLRKELETILPSYMVPGRIAAVGDFELTPNGKLDRARLASAEHAPSEDRAAADADEELLCGLVAELTGSGPVGPDDDLIDLGASSVDAARLVGMAREAGVDITLREVLRRRTVRGILQPTRASDTTEKGIR